MVLVVVFYFCFSHEPTAACHIHVCVCVPPFLFYLGWERSMGRVSFTRPDSKTTFRRHSSTCSSAARQIRYGNTMRWGSHTIYFFIQHVQKRAKQPPQCSLPFAFVSLSTATNPEGSLHLEGAQHLPVRGERVCGCEGGEGERVCVCVRERLCLCVSVCVSVRTFLLTDSLTHSLTFCVLMH